MKAKRAQGMRARRRLHIDAKRENQRTKGRWNPCWTRRQPNGEACARSQGASWRAVAGRDVEQRESSASWSRELDMARARLAGRAGRDGGARQGERLCAGKHHDAMEQGPSASEEGNFVRVTRIEGGMPAS
jgi:hypothetical protein